MPFVDVYMVVWGLVWCVVKCCDLWDCKSGGGFLVWGF